MSKSLLEVVAAEREIIIILRVIVEIVMRIRNSFSKNTHYRGSVIEEVHAQIGDK